MAPGFLVEFFQHDNFSGSVISATADDNCLVNEGFNDDISSLKVRPNGDQNLAGTYFIRNRKSGLYLDVQDRSTENGGNISQWNFHGDINQQYELAHVGNGAYAIHPVVSGKALDVSGVSTGNGANIHQWDYLSGKNQQFIARPVDGYYQLVAVHSGKVIEVANGSVDPGANVQQYANNNQPASHWSLEAVNGGPSFEYFREAEDMSASSDIGLETTSDPEGGSQNVGWIDAGDWLAYDGITFPSSGTYRFEFRVASPNNSTQLSFDFNSGTIQLGVIDVPNTGGWQNWMTLSSTVQVDAGTYSFGIFAPGGGWNINWFRIIQE